MKILGVIISQISASAIVKIKLPLTPKEEQVKIGKKFDELMVLCTPLKTRINESQTNQSHLADAMAELAV